MAATETLDPTIQHLSAGLSLQAVIRDLHYKPGTSFELREGPDPVNRDERIFVVTVAVPVVDSRPPHGPRSLMADLIVPKHVVEAAAAVTDDFPLTVLGWLRVELYKLEQHESDEWLRWTNYAPFDPHDEFVRDFDGEPTLPKENRRARY